MGKVSAGLALCMALVVVSASPAPAAQPGPIQLPVLVGSVRDACTGAKVPNLAVTLTTNPGPQQVPTKLATGSFRYLSVSTNPGPILLQVSAPGYAPLGDAAAPGVYVTINPGPVQVPSPQFVSVGVVVKILLAPTPLPATCTPRKAPVLNALKGTVKDALTGAKVPNLAVTVTTNPGPQQSPTKLKTGAFTYRTSIPGPIQLQVSAPGYAPLGDAAAPGVEVTTNPGPSQLPSPQGIAIGTKIKILLG
jgi:Carboxypeptidase regulatory-like domain